MGKIIDIGKFKVISSKAIQSALTDVAKQYRQIFRYQFANASAVAKHFNWGESVGSFIQIDDSDIKWQNGKMTIKMSDLPWFIASRAHLIQDGTIGQVFAQPGQMVYGVALQDKHRSTAKEQYEIQGFQHQGSHVIQNSIEIGKQRSDDWLTQASTAYIKQLADHISQCVTG